MGLDRRYGLDVLVNNRHHDDTWQRASTADLQVVREALEVNLFGAWQTSLTLLPAAPSRDGRIVNVSSEPDRWPAWTADLRPTTSPRRR